MALEINLVNLGTYPNDGSGDDLRTAFEKSNANFASLEDNIVLSAVNLGTGAPLWLDKLGNDLRFRTLKSLNENLSISYDSNEIILQINNFLDSVEQDTSPSLGGNLDLNGFEINGSGNIDISGVIIADGFEGVLLGNVFGDVFGSVFGNLTGNVTGQVSDISNHNLEGLGNVSTETPSIDSVLSWNGTFWKPSAVVNKIVAGANITVTPSEGTGEVVIDAAAAGAASLDELTDVEITNPASGQVLQYNGTSWVNSTASFDNNAYDFGLLSGVRSQFDLIFQFTPIDFGSINLPSTVSLDLGQISGPTYQLVSDKASVVEGDSVTISLITNNVVNGTVLPYVITGVSTQDINGTSLTGSFVVLNNSASLTIPITTDALVENESLTLTLVGITPEVSVSVNIIDAGPILPALLDGGSPSDISTVIADGEGPNTPVTVIMDGGELLG